MARKQQTSNMVVGLDIGTSKIAAIIGKIKPDGEIEVVGMGTHPSRGLKKGVVVNIDTTVESIQHAIDEAERMSGFTAESVYVGIAGSHIKSFNSNGMVAIRNQDVQADDIERVMDAAQTIAIPGDERVLHILSQEYMIDSQGGIREPIGMSGVRLEAKVHMVTGSVSAAQNITKCVERCGLEVADIILEQLASSEAVLSEDEKELGVCLVDIGGGTTDIAVFHNGAISHTAVISVAGDQVTNDIAVALRTPTQAAEEIKKKYACALPQLIDKDEEIEVASVGDRPARCLSRRTLVEVIEPRYEELFQLIQAELRSSGFEDILAAGVVLTGGSSLVEGAVELAEEVFHMPVRLGYPQGVEGLKDEVNSPSFATTVGLLMHAKEHIGHVVVEMPSESRSMGVGQVFSKMKSWFNSSF
ncbi:MAG: cell division protein FtsA [Thiomicrorhabdus sp.]|nr:MAG: cell division protein FtsA [Thiomicrorhabdus sp.]